MYGMHKIFQYDNELKTKVVSQTPLTTQLISCDLSAFFQAIVRTVF